MKVHTLKEYAELVHYAPAVTEDTTLSNVQDYFEEDGVATFWDYPLTELQYCIEEDRNVVVVQVAENEYRLCEV